VRWLVVVVWTVCFRWVGKERGFVSLRKERIVLCNIVASWIRRGCEKRENGYPGGNLSRGLDIWDGSGIVLRWIDDC